MAGAFNETKGTELAREVGLAKSMWARFWGLMGRRSLPEGHGLLFSPCASNDQVHRPALDSCSADAENESASTIDRPVSGYGRDNHADLAHSRRYFPAWSSLAALRGHRSRNIDCGGDSFCQKG